MRRFGAAFFFGKKGLAIRPGVVYNTGMRPAPEGSQGRTGQGCGKMLKKFIGYYRPHVGLFAADMV